MVGRLPVPRDPFKPPGKRRWATPKKDLEGAVQRECLLVLQSCNAVVYVERRNTGTIAFADGGRISFGATGAADIWCLVRVPSARHIPGSLEYLTHVEIECKRRDGKGRLSKDQKAFKQFCDENGIPYLVVTSALDMANQLSEKGILTN